MVDVSTKTDTARVAVAAGELHTTAEVVRLVRADGMPKADVLTTARLAGINGAKKTSELIPLCHQLALSSVNVSFGFTDTTITIEAVAKTKGPTGVEMEALTAVAVAGLTLHDMIKAVDPSASCTGCGCSPKMVVSTDIGYGRTKFHSPPTRPGTTITPTPPSREVPAPPRTLRPIRWTP